MADITDRIATNVCIYWKTYLDDPTLKTDESHCTANSFFAESLITCYKNGKCNGLGTCRDCSAYDTEGIKLSHKNANLYYGIHNLYQWDKQQKKYLLIRKLDDSEVHELSSIAPVPKDMLLTTRNYSGLQTPMNLMIYNLRSRFKKCCNWVGSSLEFFTQQDGTLYATYYGSSTVTQKKYLHKVGEEYVNIPSLNKCVLSEALPWVYPFTSQNTTAYGCNGCKPECPYYTGPVWNYCKDSKMEYGDSISAAQIMELRYYSANWHKMTSPRAEWGKRFKEPVLWAWSGGWADTTNPDPPANQKLMPMVQKVYIEDFDSIQPSINVDPPVRPGEGLIVLPPSDYSYEENSTNYPTEIKELSSLTEGLEIVWPESSYGSPYIFRTFRIGQNYIFIFIETPYPSEVYAVNITRHSQGATEDPDFIEHMEDSHPDDLYLAAPIGIGSLVVVQVELEFYPKLNEIKVFTRNPTSTEGEYLTDTVNVEHKFYHAQIAQTKGEDNVGIKAIRPWVDRFEDVHIEADIMVLQGPLTVDGIFWDTTAGSKLTTYQTVDVIIDEIQVDWDVVGCNTVVVTFADTRCNSVFNWDISGTYSGLSLGMKIDRSNNPLVGEGDADEIELEVVYKSSNGTGIPANVIVAKPKYAIQINTSTALDPRLDVLKATYRVSSLHQGPVSPDHQIVLKYPEYENNYISELPIEIIPSSDNLSFEINGSFLPIHREASDEVSASTDKLYNLDSIKNELSNRLKQAEDKAVYSFSIGGAADAEIETSAEIFDSVRTNFEDRYEGFMFSDNTPVTLSNSCQKMEEVKLHEGDYRTLVVFKDETGRPIGIKRAYFLLQSAVAETRDVEIYYEWHMSLRPWYIYNTQFLLARISEPMTSGDLEGVEIYQPECGDHSEELLTAHTDGAPDPMWYPYNRCAIPKYHEDHQYAIVKCENYVEGFGGNYEGKRWAYWERIRGPDKLYSWNAGPIYLVGCVYREVSYSYSTEGEQMFAGYTRIRSGHPQGPFSKDREALHLNRHYLKRNLKVTEEYVKREEDEFSVVWTDDYRQLAFDSTFGTWQETVGSRSESPIWVHLVDDISIVNRTTSAAQHPYAHYLLKSAGDYQYNEVFSSNRVSLKDTMSEKDLTSTAVRDFNGALVYSPGESFTGDPTQKYSDVIPVYKDKNISWAWLERPKDPERSSYNLTSVGGIILYNPTVDSLGFPPLKKNKEWACYTTDGEYELSYTAPVFNSEDGSIESNPTVSWAGGPPRVLSWVTGEWLDTGTKYDYEYYDAQPEKTGKFKLFGKSSTSSASSFLIDGTGVHKYISGITNEGEEYAYTCRGFGVNPKVQVKDLPYANYDYALINPFVAGYIEVVNERLELGKDVNFTIPMEGLHYVDEIIIDFKFGLSGDGPFPVHYDIPKIEVYIRNGNTVIQTSTSDYEYVTVQEVLESSTTTGNDTVYIHKGISYKQKKYVVGKFCHEILIKFSGLFGPSRAFMKSFKLMYRHPVDRDESVRAYGRELNVSLADSGSPDYRDLLFYYNRTFADVGDSLTTEYSSDSNYPSIKWSNRSIKDVVLEYEYVDPTATRFAYKDEVHPLGNPDVSADSDGIYSVTGNINLCNKSRTLFSTPHVNDNPQYVVFGTETYVNTNNAADNDSSTCAASVGYKKLDEQAQKCLFSEAKNLSSTFNTVYEWFWHPDEIDFWENTVRVPITQYTRTLTLKSTIPPMYRLWEHEHYGCTQQLSTPYSDGALHPIDKWQALGHRVYTGNPMFNDTCANVVIFKIAEHIGEDLYGSSEYTESKATVTWPSMSYRDRSFYIDGGFIEKRGTYMGGAIGGAGIDFWVQQSQYAHGETLPQKVNEWELDEQVYGGRESSTSAQ